MMGKWLLVVCLQVDLWTAQSTETSELCASDGSDGSAYLQSQLKASSALQVAGGVNASTTAISCTANTIDTGKCISQKTIAPDQCTGCTGQSLEPDIAGEDSFSTGSLLCQNVRNQLDEDGGKACQMAADALITFKDANDFMTCKGAQTCKGNWNVNNVGGVCCSVKDSDGQVCNNVATFTVNDGTLTDDQGQVLPKGTCVGDACCDGYETCYDVEFRGVHSMSCRGNSACYGSNSFFYLERNLYCNHVSLVSDNNNIGAVCNSAIFTFTADGDHCVQCLGKGNDSGGNACKAATFKFEKQSTVYMNCFGQDSCQSASITFDVGTGSKLYLKCRKSGACASMSLTLNNADCECEGGNKCPDVCDDVDTVDTCSEDDTACCAGVDGVDEGHPDCGNCGCGATTTTTTTTFTTVTQFDPTTTSTTTTVTGGGGGDPHVDTFDGQHYLLLKQGSFSFWHFSGLDAEVMSAKKWLKRLPVDFKMYAHYSGHLSYTKGVLLLDSSGVQQPKQVLELTSEDCLWRAHQPGTAGTWRTIDKPQLLSVPDNDGDEMTAFRFAESPKGQKMNLGLLMKQRDRAWNTVGKLFVRCKPGYHINMKMAMSSKKEMDRVDGQIASHGHTTAGDDHELPKASFLHFMNQRVRTDQEFLTPKSWMDLGGSKEAAEYLGDVDEEGPAFLKGCSEGEMSEASQTCKKYLGQPPVGAGLVSFENSLRNCIFDVCNGGGEVAAELAAEILYAD